jgi:predicted nuclease of predicted toxin-antitoxin system
VSGLSSPSEVKFLADENVKGKLVRHLSQQGVDIGYAAKGVKDVVLFGKAVEDGRVLLTHDKDFLDRARYDPKPSGGVVVLSIHPPDLPKLKSAMDTLLRAFRKQDFKGRTVVVKEDSVTVLD